MLCNYKFLLRKSLISYLYLLYLLLLAGIHYFVGPSLFMLVVEINSVFYNCLKYLFLINRCGKPNKIICFILYPFNIYTVLYIKIIIVGVFFVFICGFTSQTSHPSIYIHRYYYYLLWCLYKSNTVNK